MWHHGGRKQVFACFKLGDRICSSKKCRTTSSVKFLLGRKTICLWWSDNAMFQVLSSFGTKLRAKISSLLRFEGLQEFLNSELSTVKLSDQVPRKCEEEQWVTFSPLPQASIKFPICSRQSKQQKPFHQKLGWDVLPIVSLRALIQELRLCSSLQSSAESTMSPLLPPPGHLSCRSLLCSELKENSLHNVNALICNSAQVWGHLSLLMFRFFLRQQVRRWTTLCLSLCFKADSEEGLG